MDEKVLEELEFHQQTVTTDANSPLHLIREKEMEISGRVLAAKGEAEEIVASARKKAVETLRRAEEESERLAEEQSTRVLEEVDREVVEIGEAAEREIEELEVTTADRADKAVAFVVETVTSV